MPVLKVAFKDRCNGCELCVMEVQRQVGNVGLDGALLRVLREKNEFSIDMDPQINRLDIAKIESICPRAVFTVEKEDSPHEFIE